MHISSGHSCVDVVSICCADVLHIFCMKYIDYVCV